MLQSTKYYKVLNVTNNFMLQHAKFNKVLNGTNF